MLVVADTTPLNYLVIIGAEQVLTALYGSILVPVQVIKELLHEDAPPSVRAWANKPPAWVHVREGDATLFPLLDPGEAAALALAVETHADALLADDMEARLMAEALGLITVGTVGILGAAHNASLLDFDTAITSLRATTFHIHLGIIATVRKTLLLPKPSGEIS